MVNHEVYQALALSFVEVDPTGPIVAQLTDEGVKQIWRLLRERGLDITPAKRS